MLIGLTGTRILRPAIDAALSIGSPLVVIWRKPLSHIVSSVCRREPAIDLRMKAPTGPSIAAHTES